MANLFFNVTTKRNQQWVAFQSEQWRKRRIAVEEEEIIRPFVTISREYGCSAFKLAEQLAYELNNMRSNGELPWAVFDKALLEKIEEDHGIPQQLLESLTRKTMDEITEYFSSFVLTIPTQFSVYKKIFTTIRALAHQGNVILVGRGAAIVTKGLKHGFHIRLYAPSDWKRKQIKSYHKIKSDLESGKLMKKVNEEREGFVKKYLMSDIYDPANYNIMINNSDFSINELNEIIMCAMSKTGLLKHI